MGIEAFTDWRDERNKCSAIQAKCPLDLLQNPDSKKLNYWLSHFIVEAIGEPYPARMHNLLLAGLLRYGHSKTKFCSNFMDKNDPHFDELSGTRDSIAQQLCKDSVGASVKHAAIVTPEEETLLLDKGIMGIYILLHFKCFLLLVYVIFFQHQAHA